MCRRSNFSEGFLFGALIGAGLALLFAPGSGEETRAKIKQMHDENEDTISQAKDKTEELITKTKDAIEDGFANLTAMIDEKKQKDSPA